MKESTKGMLGAQLPGALEQDILRLNPWWRGNPLQPLQSTRRHLVAQMRSLLDKELAPAVVVRGPQQVGKTVAQLQLLEDLPGEGVPPASILRVQCDELPGLLAVQEPLLRIVDWYESRILGESLLPSASLSPDRMRSVTSTILESSG
jgi:hypothetical protein